MLWSIRRKQDQQENANLGGEMTLPALRNWVVYCYAIKAGLETREK